jgi:Domain of unknown function (DUF4062)
MARKRRLQVFISSTYLDLKEERQAAVEAILTAGHIPAGMELFAAGDQSQMTVIRQWIEESDVFLLILGGRYGSLEPASQKSYIQLEYESAAELGKPLFAVVIEDDHLNDKVKQFGRAVLETDQPQKLKEFKAVVKSRLVKFWRDPRDIKLAILETLAEFSRRSNLVGWIPGDEGANAAMLAEEIARLTKENAELRAQLARATAPAVTYNGLTFEQMYRLLTADKLAFDDLPEEAVAMLRDVARAFGDTEPGVLHYLWVMREQFDEGGPMPRGVERNWVSQLAASGIMERFGPADDPEYRLSGVGRQFLLRLTLERGGEEAKRLIVPARSAKKHK